MCSDSGSSRPHVSWSGSNRMLTDPCSQRPSGFLKGDSRFNGPERMEPHRQRARVILRSHPEIRPLMGRNPFTFFLIVLLVCCQLSLAIVLRDSSWPILLLVALLAGTIPSYGLGVLIHECAHQLVWPRRWQNMITGIIANVVHVV